MKWRSRALKSAVAAALCRRTPNPAAHSTAPVYLHPSAQLKLLHTVADCLAALEPAVNWEAEKLHGVEAPGPFDEL